MSDFTGLEMAMSVRLLVAALLGMTLGVERSLVGKHAGMRTYAMVSLGSALFVVLGTLAAYQLSMFSNINPLQIAGSIVLGIGFIGSGLAMYQGDRLEITTASGVWVVASIGMACGFGFYILAVIGTILSICIFTFFSKLERKLRLNYGVEQK